MSRVCDWAEKVCETCGEVFKPTSGRQKYCRTPKCDAIRNETNRESHNAYNRAYAAANRESVNASKRKWEANNPEKNAESKRVWRESNRDQQHETNKAWKQANPEKVRSGRVRWQHKRKLRIKENHEFYERQDIFERCGWVCQLCDLPVDPNLTDYLDPGYATIDHILPLSLGGGDTPDNVQLAHFRCNTIKNNRVA